MVTLTPEQRDLLTEVMNIASGRAAAALARLLDQRVHLQVVQVAVLDREATQRFLEHQLGLVGSAVEQPFHNAAQGTSLLVLPHQEATQLIRMLLGAPKDLETLSATEESALAEMGNIVLNACIAVLGNLLGDRFIIGVPRVFFNLPGTHLSRLLTSHLAAPFQTLVLTSTLSTRETQLVFYTLLVLALRADDLETLLDNLSRHLLDP